MRTLKQGCAAVLGVIAMCFLPSAAAGAEQIKDGGFEGATCDASDCSDLAWPQGVTSAFATSTGPICRSGTGSGDNLCTGQGSIPATGVTWARLGAGYKASAMFGGGISTFLDQNVPLPAGLSATLSFRLRIINTPGPIGNFTVEVGGGDSQGTTVFEVTDATPGFSSYAPVSVDVSSFAGSTPRFRFQGSSSQDPVGPLDSFDLDDISVAAVDPRCGPLRKKLKKAKTKKAKRKIRKKLRKLGC